MARSVGSVAVSVVPSAEGFAEKLRAQLGNLPSVRLVLDTAEATAKVDALRGRLDEIRNGHARVDLDTAAAEAHLLAIRESLERMENKRVNVDVDDSGSSSNVGARIASAIGNASLLSKAKVALIGEGILALIPLAGAAAAAVAAIGGGIAAAGAGMLVGRLAFAGIGQALSAAQQPSAGGGAVARAGNQVQSAQLAQQSQAIAARQAAQSAADGVQSALEGQRSAETSLISAQQNALQAQRDLNAARIAAKQTLEDLSNQVIDNGLAQRQAVLSLQQAKRALDIAQANPNASNPANAGALAQLQLNYDQAKQQQAELVLQGQRLAAQRQAATKAGVEGAQNVVQAEAKVRDSQTQLVTAHQQVTDAARKLAEARQNVTDTATRNAIAEQQSALSLQNAGIAAGGAAAGLSAYALAMAKLDPVQQGFVRFLQSVKPQLDGLKRAAADSFLPLLQGAIQTALPALPALERVLSTVGRAMGQLATEAAHALTGPFWQQFLSFLSGSLAPMLLQIGPIFGHLFAAGAAAFQQFAPLIDQVLGMVGRLASGLSAGVSGGGLTGLISFITSNLPAVASTLHTVFGAVGAVIRGLAPAGAPALALFQLLAGEIQKLAPILSPLVAAFARLAVQALGPVAPILTRLVSQLVPPLITFLQRLAPLVPSIATAFARLVESFIPLLPLISGVLPDVTSLVSTLAPFAPIILAVVEGIRLIVAATKAWSAIQAAFNIIMDANPIALIVIGIAALAVGLVEAYRHSQTFRDIVQGVFHVVQSVVGAVVRWFEAYVVPTIKVVFDVVSAYVHGWFVVVRDVFNGASSIIRGVLSGIHDIFTTGGAILSKAWHLIWDTFGGIVTDAFKGVRDAINGILGFIQDAINTVLGAINDIHVHIPKVSIAGHSIGGEDFGFHINPVQIPRLANGAIVNPTADGTIARLAEAGYPEVVLPLDPRRVQQLQGIFGGGKPQTNNFTIHEAVTPNATAQAVVNRLRMLNA